MSGDLVVSIILACIGSTGLSSLIQFLVKRKDDRKENKFTAEDRQNILIALESIRKTDERLLKLEQSTDRLQLLNLIQNDPKNVDAIITLGNHYFQVLKGNMYMTSLFTDWAKAQKIDEQVIHECIKK